METPKIVKIQKLRSARLLNIPAEIKNEFKNVKYMMCTRTENGILYEPMRDD